MHHHAKYSAWTSWEYDHTHSNSCMLTDILLVHNFRGQLFFSDRMTFDPDLVMDIPHKCVSAAPNLPAKKEHKTNS